MPARPRGAPVLRLAAWAPMALAMRQAAVMFISPATRGALGPQGGRRCRRGAPLLARRASGLALEVDPEYPGTAVQRLRNIQDRVRSLSRGDLDGDWEEVRRKLLWAGGLRDLPDAQPGRGYTGHAFNDHNHCDLTAMLGDVSHNENDGPGSRLPSSMHFVGLHVACMHVVQASSPLLERVGQACLQSWVESSCAAAITHCVRGDFREESRRTPPCSAANHGSPCPLQIPP
ncbi:unnamed protein product [Prorocentrum cordatum]|uniref:Uncharacterized protein n=1 Tax=Prorocentrum cordatum TaxID=2364126 RepID=A0ABN9S6Y2_9DINO|nr:unnamed protein product [Polarella glacialis]